MASPENTGSRTRPRKAPLSQELVLSTALALVDAEGLDALTMRRLGQELDRDPMSLYRYAANRAALLDIEITESAAITDLPSAVAQLRTLVDSGIGVALDDYGTAYSSLSLLRELPLTGLKLDKSFIDTIDTDPTSAVLVASVMASARALGLRTTAEGVERETQLEVLRDLGCDTAQGYLIARPLPPAELPDAWPVGTTAGSAAGTTADTAAVAQDPGR